jgi:hypothetical protein
MRNGEEAAYRRNGMARKPSKWRNENGMASKIMAAISGINGETAKQRKYIKKQRQPESGKRHGEGNYR